MEDPRYQQAVEMAKKRKDYGQFKVGDLVE
jgi:hypothetical protein